MAVSNIITEESLPKIDAALASLAEAKREAELAKRAGFDVVNQLTQIDDAESKLRLIKQVYFPNAS